MPITAKNLKKVGVRWILDSIRFEPNARFGELVGTLRELGMTDMEIRNTVKAAVKQKTDAIVEEALKNAKVSSG